MPSWQKEKSIRNGIPGGFEDEQQGEKRAEAWDGRGEQRHDRQGEEHERQQPSPSESWSPFAGAHPQMYPLVSRAQLLAPCPLNVAMPLPSVRCAGPRKYAHPARDAAPRRCLGHVEDYGAMAGHPAMESAGRVAACGDGSFKREG